MYKVFSKDNCVYCTKAKTLLSNLKLPYEEHKLSPTFTPDKMFEMIGKQVTIVANLAPRPMMGTVSEGMILMAEDAEGNLRLIQPNENVNPGSTVS